MSPLRSVLLTLTLAGAAVPAHAATIVDFIDGTGAQSFAGVTTPGTDPSDWFTFYGTADTPIVLETLAPSFDTIIRLYRTPLGPAVAGSLVSTFVLVEEDDDDGPGNLSFISRLLPLDSFYAVEILGFRNAAGVYSFRTTGDVAPVVTDTAAVPEPATWVLVGTALCVGGARMRVRSIRRRR